MKVTLVSTNAVLPQKEKKLWGTSKLVTETFLALPAMEQKTDSGWAKLGVGYTHEVEKLRAYVCSILSKLCKNKYYHYETRTICEINGSCYVYFRKVNRK